MFTKCFLKWVGVCDVLYLVSVAGLMLVGRGYRGSHNGSQSSNP